MTSDADGNTLTDASGRTLTWDSQNRLTSCTKGGVTSTYTYGADGLRRSSTVNGVTTYYAYDGTMLVREMQKTGGTGALVNTATYLQGPRGAEYRRDDTQTELDSQGRQVSVCRWYVYDGLGSVVGEVDVNGNLTSSPKYDVYGAVRANGGSASSRQGFVGGLGHVSDTETGLIYMRARYYDPSLGRFESQDPSRNGNNWFVYADNNPIDEVDANGCIATDLAMDIFLALSGIQGVSLASFETWQSLSNQAATNILGGLVNDLRTGAKADLATAGECEVEAENYQARQNDDAAAAWKVEAKSSLAQSALKSAAVESIRLVRQILESEL